MSPGNAVPTAAPPAVRVVRRRPVTPVALVALVALFASAACGSGPATPTGRQRSPDPNAPVSSTITLPAPGLDRCRWFERWVAASAALAVAAASPADRARARREVAALDAEAAADPGLAPLVPAIRAWATTLTAVGVVLDQPDASRGEATPSRVPAPPGDVTVGLRQVDAVAARLDEPAFRDAARRLEQAWPASCRADP